MVPVIYHEGYRVSLSRGAVHQESKYAALMDLLAESELSRHVNFHTPNPVSLEMIKGAHDAGYVERVRTQSLRDDEIRRIGLAQSEQLFLRPSLGAGGTLLAARLALEHGIACNMAGGSHHAHAGFGSGFCVFNDVAIAAHQLLEQKLTQKILIIDLDVHQGDGTAAIFAADTRVITMSVHCEKNFPFRKSKSDLDIGLAPNTGDADYLTCLEAHIPALLEAHRPDIVFYNAGVDPHACDRLGYLALSDHGLRARERLVVDKVSAASIPLVTVMGGGYGDDRYEVARRHLVLFEEIIKYRTT